MNGSPPSSPGMSQLPKNEETVFDQVEVLGPVTKMSEISLNGENPSVVDISRRSLSLSVSSSFDAPSEQVFSNGSDSSTGQPLFMQDDSLSRAHEAGTRESMVPGGSESSSSPPLAPGCTGCKTSDSAAVANCFSCASLLCANCVIAHQLMVAFEGHQVASLGQQTTDKTDTGKGLKTLIGETRKKLADIQKTSKIIDYSSSRLTSNYEKAVGEVAESHNFYLSMLSERKMETMKELDKAYSSKQVQLSVLGQKCQESIDHLELMTSYMEKLANTGSPRDIALFQPSLEQRVQGSFVDVPSNCELAEFSILEFISNFQAIQVGVRNQFGYVKVASERDGSRYVGAGSKQPPISRPATTTFASQLTPLPTPLPSSSIPGRTSFSAFDFQNNLSNSKNFFGQTSLSSGFCSLSQSPDLSLPCFSPPDTTLAIPSPSPRVVYPPKAQIKRQKMIYHCKFGEFGILEGQFTEPSGVAVTNDNEIVVADTNNHRIQVFDKDGNFRFQFGEVGKRDGQLLYPNRVAVFSSNGDIIVTERSPTHQVQIFSKFGHFIRKFGADVLQHPRGVAVDSWGRIIVVECKVMRVVIFDTVGNVLNKFSCSRHLEFPNGVTVNDQQEIFISDNRAHCVKVFDYQGNYLRQIGGEGVSNFPIGVGLMADGNVAIADNHNNFNLTVFSQAGQILWALESKVKHAQCFDVALMKDGSIVLASKDYRLYIYRYVKVPSIAV